MIDKEMKNFKMLQCNTSLLQVPLEKNFMLPI